MSVELLDTPRFHGFRVRRQIDGQTYQEYFSLKENGKRIRGARREAIKRKAQARDQELANAQRRVKEKAAKEVHIDEKGRVRGILFRMKTEKSGSKTPVFQIGIMSTREDKIVNTTVSINRHGLQDAWRKAVDFYARHKRIGRQSRAYDELMRAKPSQGQLRKLTRRGSATGRARTKAARRSASRSAQKRRAPSRRGTGARRAAGMARARS